MSAIARLKNQKMPESKLQKLTLEFLKEHGIYHFKTITSNKNGVPDCVACPGGFFLALEFKTNTGRLSPLQEVARDQIEFNGGRWYTVRPATWDKVMGAILALHLERRRLV